MKTEIDCSIKTAHPILRMLSALLLALPVVAQNATAGDAVGEALRMKLEDRERLREAFESVPQNHRDVKLQIPTRRKLRLVAAGARFRQTKVDGVARFNFPVDVAVDHRRDPFRTVLAEPDCIGQLVSELYVDGVGGAGLRVNCARTSK